MIEVVDLQDQCLATDRDDGLAWHAWRPDARGDPGGALASDGGGFERVAVGHHGHETNHAALRKIHFPDSLVRTVEHLLRVERGRRQLRGESPVRVLTQ